MVKGHGIVSFRMLGFCLFRFISIIYSEIWLSLDKNFKVWYSGVRTVSAKESSTVIHGHLADWRD